MSGEGSAARAGDGGFLIGSGIEAAPDSGPADVPSGEKGSRKRSRDGEEEAFVVESPGGDTEAHNGEVVPNNEHSPSRAGGKFEEA